MAKKRPYKLLLYVSLVVVVVGLIGGSLTDSSILGFKLLALNGVTNKDIICYFKTTTAILDTKNGYIGEDNSPFLIGSPSFTFVAENGNKIGALNHFAKIRCNTGINTIDPNNYQFCSDPATGGHGAQCVATNGGKLVVKPATLTVTVFSKDSRNHLIQTFTAPLQTQQTVLELGQEKRLNLNGNAVHIPIDSILKKLDQGTYDSLQTITITGKLQMYYEGFNYPSVTYTLNIPENSALTWVNLKGLQNTIGVIYPDEPVIGEEPIGEEEVNVDNNPNQDDPNITNLSKAFFDVANEWGSCLILGDYECLGQTKFWGIYALIVVVIAIAIITKKEPRKVLIDQ